MENQLPDEFDLLVIGTGFPESCVAAAASRIGKTVIHIDPNDFYGGTWTSFNLDTFCEFITKEVRPNAEVINGSVRWHIDAVDDVTIEKSTEPPTTLLVEKIEINEEKIWTKSELLEQTRRFNIDLCPKILYSAGNLVSLLISSNICRYAEFRAIDHVCTIFKGEILNVPCTRSDVFNTSDLTIIEKRLLMKFLNTCLSYGEQKCDNDNDHNNYKTFYDYLKAHNLTEKIITCVIQAIAMGAEDTPFVEGMECTKRFLKSLGRYGQTAFLFPMYGCGEIPQCFCRLSAVFGGIYCLKRNITSMRIDADTNMVTASIDDMQIKAKHVVCSHGNVPTDITNRNVGISGFGRVINRLSRGVFITSTPLGNNTLNSGGGGVNLLRLLSGKREAILIQLSHYSGTCPKGIYIFHITTMSISDEPESDLQPFTAQIFNDELQAPKMILSAFFTITACDDTGVSVDALTPLFCTAAPFYELDYDRSIENAKDVFDKIYKDVEFLPRAPDPEEIVVGDEDPQALSANELAEDLREHLQELTEAIGAIDVNNTTTTNHDGDARE